MLHVLTNYNTLHENHDNQIEILMLPDELGNKLLVNRDSFFKELNEYTSKIKTIADFMANDIVSLSKYIISKVIMENGELIK